ncbi:YegP family protein [Pararhizobium mangrovi]|uniref:DUF1508 domain-containing protein n=1 Tax=Pararhizobium mangrovi TaxID=2590452 RepID=A0A506UA58_9HYPH|nr:DUF1508 domain-containing protein [Pararhizobium mangrovi]TPW28697.1 DUF1508 domain-containing protein [Pararhizobium mangrovi]
MKFHIFKDNKGEYRWHLKADNGEIVADSAEGYSTKQSAQHGIDLAKSASNAQVQDDS